jgi:hypothetical protein
VARPSPDGSSAFASAEEARCYWIEHRVRLLEALARNGRRPHGWWCFDDDAAGLHYDRDTERSVLYEAGELGPEEEAELLADWHHEFVRSNDPSFRVCLGPGRFLHGEAARRAHYAWADIPLSLVAEWSVERVSPDDQTTAVAVHCA